MNRHLDITSMELCAHHVDLLARTASVTLYAKNALTAILYNKEYAILALEISVHARVTPH